ncbi:hypothetical protein OUZ56_020108 [Daphnia magna]|uniref:Small EDRK-rich factor-like N-terminal domain-containing protein n=2 Tax=Daphnia magna TaxID=35525 RepID=A0ABQ9ZEA3_9CRUS|nr:hypothetical protein OUZ56_020108 [Daphnia magna]
MTLNKLNPDFRTRVEMLRLEEGCRLTADLLGRVMARGQQKIQSQQKANEKAAKAKKQQGHSASEQKKAAMAALVHVCAVCKSQMPDPKTYKQHFENKHPKNPLPADLQDVAA